MIAVQSLQKKIYYFRSKAVEEFLTGEKVQSLHKYPNLH